MPNHKVHKMPNGHMMKDSEMKKMMGKKSPKTKKRKAKRVLGA